MTGPVVALVVAAGSGVRLGGEGPKALRRLAGKPLLLHALHNLAAGGVDSAVVIIRETDRSLVAAALDGLAGLPVAVVAGGAERQDSVRLGLDALPHDPAPSVVLVHDAARPLVDPGTIARVIAAVRSGARAVVPGIPVVDTIRQYDADDQGGSHGLDRSRLVAVQTPQGFDPATLRAAHDHVRELGLTVTDDAGACEQLGVAVRIVPGSVTGIKITHPQDLGLAEVLLTTGGAR